ncbi:OmpA family protein [Tenacibaculum aiptasiae]|uniref:OmpA family protein n=1 Tax=Tenacibaculum aiptasiae TaxID=426481 RepID=UPI0023302D0B|nr:OmpA family protein [Tenacibaculum aiptasiae]
MKKIIFIVILLNTVLGYSQRKYAANRYFKEYAYKKAAELYESIYQKGDTSMVVISRLGDAYYFNTESIEAEKWYALLMKKHEAIVLPEYIFRYAQVLKSNGKVKESDIWLRKLKKVKSTDSRAIALEKNKDYFVNYSKKKKTFVNINNLSSNTAYSDFGGFIFNNKLYFASTKPQGTKFDKNLYKWNNQPFLNIYEAEETFNDENELIDVSGVKKVKSINTRYHESNVIITRDGKTMYFTRDNYNDDKLKGDKNSVTHLKIFKAENVEGEWKNVKELPFNADGFSCGHPALSPDEKTLYFVSDMPGGIGATDIYKVNILGNDSYSKPENLGNTINTEGREMFPYVGMDGTLYFSSDGHLGLGALDVFESRSQNNSFLKPVNLGAPVNGSLDDFAFVINDEKTSGFFSSNRKGGKGDDDIYSYMIYNCKESIKGTVTAVGTNESIENAMVKLIDEKGNVLKSERTNEDGSYIFDEIDCEKKFVVIASKEDYRNDQKEVQTLDVNKKSIVTNLQLESLIVEDQIVINPIYFDFDLYDIREDAEYELEHIVSVMKNNPEMIIKIESHTDSRGTKKYNKQLSKRRAISTRNYIVSRGISEERIESAIGYGEEQLLNNCDDLNQNKCTKEEHQKNRRSYFYIVNLEK